MPRLLSWVTVHGLIRSPPLESSKAARALTRGSERSPQWFSLTAGLTLICQRPHESSPEGLWAAGLPPDSAMAIAVQVTASSGLKPASRQIW